MSEETIILLMGMIGGALFWQFITTLSFGFSGKEDKLPYYIAGGFFVLALKVYFWLERLFTKLTYRRRLFK